MAKQLSKGDQIPEFKLQDQNEQEINITDRIGVPLVIYFYPKDDTPGCVKEACSFRDQFDVFKDYGAEVIGISGDSPSSHARFAKKYRLNFTLLSDKGGRVQKLFGVPKSLFGLLPGRVTYIVDKEGIIRHTFNSQFNAEKHVDEALKIIKSL